LGEPFSGKTREQRSKISFVSDTPSFYDDMTAEDHIRFVLQASHQGSEYERAEKLLESFALKRFVGQYPSSFSRGMREKLALVIAFTLRPELFLFDEPYGPLDRKASGILSSEIKARASEGASVILSCHHLIPDLKPSKVLLLDEGNLMIKSDSILDEIWCVGADLTESADEYRS
jgi:ABC-2 type transport system ATP-binding protein